ncbi:MAG: Dna2/Cas4 domain-containing protein [Candidatus ainarchaeum sp.]|nr:Dna2/Cas4 domain-containing protein [Candidatus ainarchaeum sp.]
MKLTGTLIKNYCHCKRQAYLYFYGINFENELTKIGKLNHIEKGSDELIFDEIKIDKIKGDEVIEFKKSSSNLEGTKLQLLYYLYLLKQKNIIKIGKLKDLTYGNEYVLELDDENYLKINSLINELSDYFTNQKMVPEKKISKKQCKGCSFFYYCWC